MYSRSDIAVDKVAGVVDKGLGFDFSAITDLVKTALPVGLNIFQQQMQLKQVKVMQQPGYIQSPGVYGQQYGILPMSQTLQPQPTFGGQYTQPSSGIGTGTMLAIGAAAIVGLLAFKMLR
jgi:hypothetical protein